MPGRTVGNAGEDSGEERGGHRGGQRGSHRNTPLTQITRTQEHAHPTSHAHLCDCRGAGGRMCMMVAQHSENFVLVLRVP